MFDAVRDNDLTTLARTIESTVSRHLSHATTGSKVGEEHPDAWPVLELTVALVGGLARFMEALDTEQAAWFVPTPSPIYDELITYIPLSAPTAISENASVAELTNALQGYLQITPPPT